MNWIERNSTAIMLCLLYWLLFLVIFWKLDVKHWLRKIKRNFWHKHVLTQWYCLWVRQNEFYHSLDIDQEAILKMNNKKRDQYLTNLHKRRQIAHNRDLKKNS